MQKGHTPMLANVLISRLGIFQIQRKNSTRGERLRTQSKSHDMHGNDVVYPGGGENDATAKANVIILGGEDLSSGQSGLSTLRFP